MKTRGSDGMHLGWIEGAHGPLFASYHPAQGAQTRDCGVLFCDAFGSDRMRLHLCYRSLAVQLAAAGFSALRVDYPGTCDSGGDELTGEGQVQRWLASLHTAADWLRRESGVTQLCVFGALLGGTVGASLAAQRDDVRGLVLWGPYADGRGFLREIAAFGSISQKSGPARKPDGWREGDQEAVGFVIPAATAEELRGLKPLAGAQPRLRYAGIFRRNQTASVDAWADFLRASGADVFVRPGAATDIASIGGDGSPPPPALMAEMVSYVQSQHPPAATPTASSSTGGDAAPAAPRDPTPFTENGAPRLLDAVSVTTAEHRVVREEVVRFGNDESMIGVVTTGERGVDAASDALILVNGGTNHRVGINRNYTEWARAYAPSGMLVLRMDVRGLGDSPPLRPEDLGVLYREATRDDVREAMDFLARRYGVRRFVLLGLCAGGYQAFHCALADERVSGLVYLSPARFLPVSDADRGGRSELAFAGLAHYRRALLDPAAWRRALGGKTDLVAVARSVADRAVARVTQRLGALGTLAGVLAPRPKTWLAGALLRLADRGCHVLLAFPAQDAELTAFEDYVSADRQRLMATGRFSVEVVQDADHIFSQRWSQQYLRHRIEQALVDWRGRPGSDAPRATSRR